MTQCKNIVVPESSKDDIEKIKRFLLDFKDLGFNAIVAGGWIRDIYLGQTPKDIDIFVCPEDSMLKFLCPSYCGREETEKVHTGAQEFVCDVDYMHTTNFREEVICVAKYKDGYDFISVSTHVEELVAGFDCSICQIWLELDDDKLCVYCLEDFIAHEDGVIHHYKNIAVRDDHKARLTAKYPSMDWIEKEFCSNNKFYLGYL